MGQTVIWTGPSLSGPGSFPPAPNPTPILSRNVMRGGASGKPFPYNAVRGRGREVFRCQMCEAKFEFDQEAARHCATYGHTALRVVAYEVRGVCMDDDPSLWFEGL